MKRILWTSWSADCAKFDLARISNIPFKHQWLNGHEHAPGPGDILLTGNGYNYQAGPFYKATLYAEPYIYLRGEYDRFQTDKRWDRRFVYNPSLFIKHHDTAMVPIAGYWRCDGILPVPLKTITFGMVLSKKPGGLHQTDIGHVRKEFVNKLKGKSFVYWGSGWDKNDPNYRGEVYLSDNKFLDSQRLLLACKFGLALDNSIIPGYLTEKFWNSLGAGCVPIYFGCADIKDRINPEAYIFGPDFKSIDEIIEHCESMDEQTYLKKQKAAIEVYTGDRKHAWEDIFWLMDNILHRI